MGNGTWSARVPCLRLLLASVLLLAGATLPPLGGAAMGRSLHRHAADLNLVRYVNPFIGTDIGGPGYGIGNEGGHVFPGAAYPQGMVQWSPDTTTAAGGYRYGSSTINGFSLTHFSGRGCSAYQDFPFTPTVGSISRSPAGKALYSSRFSHSNEAANPGYYRVQLANGVGVALSVTPRTGFGRFTYPASTSATMLINAGGSATGDNSTGTGVQIVGSDTVTGSASSGNFCGNNAYTIYFAARFDHPFIGLGTWNGATLSPGSRSSAGSQSGAYVTFDTTQQAAVQVKVGISFVSVANARANIDAENPNWDFSAVRSAASQAWNQRLNEIQASGGTASETTIFYTALYHTLFHPNIFSDVNGQYIGFDRQVHTARGYTQYENYPGWDMYRSLIRLRALLEPAQIGDMMQSLVTDAQQGGGGLPRWEVANDNSGGMIGDSQDVEIATSYAFGARHFDTKGALQAMLLGASKPGTLSGKDPVREGLSSYLAQGYVTIQGADGSVARTLEYTSDDFSIAQFAAALGNTSTANTYLQRAQNWRNLFNPATGYIEPRNADGAFIANFDPTSQDQFREGDAAQYVWLVPYNLRGLFDALGGNAQVISRLDTHFTQLNAGPTSLDAFMANEPEFEVPWEYDFAGAPYRTQSVVRAIETNLFSATPGGLSGNDDGGALSSWYVFAALGLYPEIPGVAGFVVGSPLFPSITVRLGSGHTLQINAQGAADSAPYVQSLGLNGQPYNSPWLPYSALSGGATLQFTLGPSPNTAWGSDPAKAPPSFGGPGGSPTSTPTRSPTATATPQAGTLQASFNNVGISRDNNRGSANFDGLGYSYSAQALQAAGIAAGQPVVYQGVTFTWPSAPPGTLDNVIAQGQTIALASPRGGSSLAFLGAANNGPSVGTGSISYTDGTSQSFQLGLSDWTLNAGTAAQPSYGNGIVATMPYRNQSGGPQSHTTYVFYTAIPLQSGKLVARVMLPASVSNGRLHIFALSVS